MHHTGIPRPRPIAEVLAMIADAHPEILRSLATQLASCHL
jgi:hypothetical protein